MGEVIMQSPAKVNNRTLRALMVSVLLHATLIVCLLVLAMPRRNAIIQPVQPQIVAQLAFSGGSHKIRIVLPASQMAAHTHEPDANADASKKTIIPMQTPPVEKSGGGSPVTPHHGDGSAKALRGNGSDNDDIRPAFPIFSPRPPVHDRSLLSGAEQKIVVDVDVDASGQVVGEKLVKGIGNKLDQTVLDIVKTWRFQPATVNGKPVPTEAELIFPFDKNYPIDFS
jgi:TonB family protein